MRISIETIKENAMTNTISYLNSQNIDYVISTDGRITINDNLTIDPNTDIVFEGVEAINGYVYVQQGATFTAPALKDVHEVCLEGEFLGENITVIDGIGCVVLSSKEKDGVTIRSCKKSTFKKGKLAGERFYVASQANTHAHGKTMREALQELQFKTGTRNIDQYRNMPITTKKKPDEWAFIYRIVTGACQYGVKSFMSSKGKLKKAYTLAEIINETNGAYGSEAFRKVVCGKEAA